MVMIPKINCAFYTKHGSCCHPDRGRVMFMHKPCLLLSDFVGCCLKMVKHQQPPPPPPPPPKRDIKEDIGWNR